MRQTLGPPPVLWRAWQVRAAALLLLRLRLSLILLPRPTSAATKTCASEGVRHRPATGQMIPSRQRLPAASPSSTPSNVLPSGAGARVRWAAEYGSSRLHPSRRVAMRTGQTSMGRRHGQAASGTELGDNIKVSTDSTGLAPSVLPCVKQSRPGFLARTEESSKASLCEGDRWRRRRLGSPFQNPSQRPGGRAESEGGTAAQSGLTHFVGVTIPMILLYTVTSVHSSAVGEGNEKEGKEARR